ncbi:MAG: putative bifunctional diguanylate cyclase/phosphodiesterase [Pseudomonadota bacterium]
MKTETMDLEHLRQRAESRVKPTLAAEAVSLQPHEIPALLHELRVHEAELELQNEELRRTQQTLILARDKYTQLYDSAPVAYCTLDSVGIILECNHSMSALLQRGRDQLLRHPLARFVVDRDLPALTHKLKSHQQQSEQKLQLKLPNGDTLHTLLHLRRTEAHALGEPSWLITINDITRLHKLTLELEVRSRALDSALEGVMITDRDNNICYVNRAFIQTTGFDEHEVIGRTPALLRSGKQDREFYRNMWRDLNNSGHWQGEIWNRRASGEVFPEWLSITTIQDEWGVPLYYVGVFSDITREENVRRRLHQLAYYDGVTGLPNRHLFLDRLKHQLSQSQRSGQPFALLVMDLDRFKSINDSMGHTVGDLLLQKVGERLKCNLRDNDTVARLGGDEFVVILPDAHSHKDTNQVAKKLISAISSPVNLEGRLYHISMSVGISLYPEHGISEEHLMKHADTAMYKAKDMGRNTFHTYTPNLNERLVERLDLEQELRQALVSCGLSLAYQPQFDLATGDIAGVEALLRWNHPAKGAIAPAEFITIAEESGLIVDIGYWVMQTAAQQYMEWVKQDIDIGCLSINLSPHQFMQTNLVERIGEILDETGMPAQWLGIEITESAAMPNFEYSVKTLQLLRQMGATVYIDDFGTGFSSLSHLRHLPIDAIKIDQVFIKQLPGSLDDLAITQAIIAMANTLNLQIVAEGVESSEQIEFLRSNGCHTAQGFALAKPMSADEFIKMRR